MTSSEVVVDPSPFDLIGGGSAAALCLHGLTGTPYEVRPLGEALARAGIRAVGPALPGHNETPDQLAHVGYEQWLEAARCRLGELRAQHDSVFMVGLSMGGLLSLALAADEVIEGLVVVGTPLHLRSPLVRLVPWIKHLRRHLPKAGGSDIADPEARRRHPSYDVMPLASIHELMRLQRRVRPALGRVKAPLLVAHGARDRTADPADSKEIFESVGSADREILILESSAHLVSVDLDGPRLAHAVVDFLGRYA